MVRIIPEPDIPTLSTISSSRSPQIHVLSVDDNAIDRKIVERLLMASAFKVTTAESGCRALEILGIGGEGDASVLANAYGVNLIITDYCMPGMTGYDLLKKVKETPALKDIPVVIISSENNADRIKRCLVEGAEEFLPKPLKLSDIKRLKSLTCQRKVKTVEQSGRPISVKRKTISDSLSTEKVQKRPRLDVVAVS